MTMKPKHIKMTKSVVINVRSIILMVFRPAGGNLVLATE
jgi:hypothetical protein